MIVHELLLNVSVIPCEQLTVRESVCQLSIRKQLKNGCSGIDSVFVAGRLLYAVTLTFDLEHLQCIACDVMKLH